MYPKFYVYTKRNQLLITICSHFTVLEIASGEHIGNVALLETESKSYAHEMRRIARSDIHEENTKGIYRKR